MPITFRCDCGKLYWTADANSGRRMICIGCGREVDVPGERRRPDPGIEFLEPSGPITSPKAIASFVLGLLPISFIPFLTPVAAVILGMLALFDIQLEPSRLKGKDLAIAGIGLGCFWSVVGIMILSGTFPEISDWW